MEFKAEVVTKTSKDGNQYTCLEIIFPSGYKKLVFLTPAEKHLIEVCR